MRLQRIPEKEVLLTALLPLENPHTPFLPEACTLPSSACPSSRVSLPLGAAPHLLLHIPGSLLTLCHWRAGLSCWTSEKAPLSPSWGLNLCGQFRSVVHEDLGQETWIFQLPGEPPQGHLWPCVSLVKGTVVVQPQGLAARLLASPLRWSPLLSVLFGSQAYGEQHGSSGLFLLVCSQKNQDQSLGPQLEEPHSWPRQHTALCSGSLWLVEFAGWYFPRAPHGWDAQGFCFPFQRWNSHLLHWMVCTQENQSRRLNQSVIPAKELSDTFRIHDTVKIFPLKCQVQHIWEQKLAACWYYYLKIFQINFSLKQSKNAYKRLWNLNLP